MHHYRTSHHGDCGSAKCNFCFCGARKCLLLLPLNGSGLCAKGYQWCKVPISIMRIVFYPSGCFHHPASRTWSQRTRRWGWEEEAGTGGEIKETFERKRGIAERYRRGDKTLLNILQLQGTRSGLCNNLFCAERQKNRLAEKTHRHEERAGGAWGERSGSSGAGGEWRGRGGRDGGA